MSSGGFARLLGPRAIAVIGASDNPDRIGGQPVMVLQDTGFRGAIYPVNPKYQRVHGLACFPDVASVPKPCDLAIVAVNAAAVPQMIRDCGAAGIPYAIVFSAGFREAGPAGAALEEQLKAATHATRGALHWPELHRHDEPQRARLLWIWCGFRHPHLKRQTGRFRLTRVGFAFSVVALADFEGIGFNYVVSAGNETDITTLDLITEFLERDDTKVVVSYMEASATGGGCAVGRRALELGKPSGVESGRYRRRARRRSHTASMTADYALYRAAFEEGGFLEIEDVHDLVDAARVS
jgi:acyl-CoA synthetase (NDP forming)